MTYSAVVAFHFVRILKGLKHVSVYFRNVD
jgi:hypothetical protein